MLSVAHFFPFVHLPIAGHFQWRLERVSDQNHLRNKPFTRAQSKQLELHTLRKYTNFIHPLREEGGLRWGVAIEYLFLYHSAIANFCTSAGSSAFHVHTGPHNKHQQGSCLFYHTFPGNHKGVQPFLSNEEEPLKNLNWCRICTTQNKKALITSGDAGATAG